MLRALGNDSYVTSLASGGTAFHLPPLSQMTQTGPYTTYVKEKGNKGMTSVAIIETSHIALHIWDETNPGLMQLDVYSCADFSPQDVFDEVEKMFDTKKIEYKFLDREKELVEVNI